MDIDFNLDNYNLQELLGLFHLNYNFNIDDLKKAKKIVIQLHPDKSGLDKEYFLFYCKAFRIIKSIYDFKNKKQGCLNNQNSKIEYLVENETDTEKKILVENLFKKDKKYFHEWFNKTFEKINIVDEERKMGYGEWFQSNNDIDNTETTLNTMHQKIKEKKEALSLLTVIHDIQSTNSTASIQTLDGSVPSSYSSEIFSKLPYEDLKKAHTETVVPVCDKDYNNVLKFNNVEVLRRYRNSQNMKPLTEEQTQQYLSTLHNEDEQDNVQLAYKLARQEEIIEEANNLWWSNLRLLK